MTKFCLPLCRRVPIMLVGNKNDLHMERYVLSDDLTGVLKIQARQLDTSWLLIIKLNPNITVAD